MNEMIHNIMDKKGTVILLSTFVVLFALETIASLRVRKQSRKKRIIINTIFSLQGFATLRLILLPSMVWVAYKNEDWNFGLNYIYDLHTLAEGAVAFVILDYSNYFWHVLNHKSAFLWRFHLVHHTDLDLDVTTAIRFHAGELFFSAFYRSLAVLLTGASPTLVIFYEVCFEVATLFHHSNWKLSLSIEKIINKIFVTPRMHGIHHSTIRNETDSNFSVIFSFWDRINGTAKLNVAQRDIEIGVPTYANPEALTVLHLLKLPFTKIKQWENHMLSRGKSKKIN